MKRLASLTCIAAIAAFASEANLQSGSFAGHTWSLQVPSEYLVVGSAQPEPRFSMTGFAPEPRADGSRPMIQITLLDVRESNSTLFKEIGKAMISGVQKRREEWKVTESETTVGEVRAIRYEWSGIVIPAPDGASMRLPARGVMIVGIDDGVAFTLHSQDADEYAKETLALTEPAMRTFRIAKK